MNILGFLDAKGGAERAEELFARPTTRSTVSARALLTDLRKASSDGSESSVLTGYLQEGHYDHLKNREVKQALDTYLTKLANSGKGDSVQKTIHAMNRTQFITDQIRGRDSLITEIVKALVAFITNPESRRDIFRRDIAPKILNDDGLMDPNHRLLKDARGIGTLPDLVKIANALGLQEEIGAYRANISSGNNLDGTISTTVIRRQIESDMKELETIVSPDTGSVYEGDLLRFEALSVSGELANKINTAAGKPDLLRAGEKLDFYKWIQELKEAATHTDDSRLSEVTNTFISKYLGALREQARNASAKGESTQKYEQLAKDFKDWFILGRGLLPQGVSALVKRGLAYSLGIDKDSAQILTASGIEDAGRTALAKVIDEIRDTVIPRHGSLIDIDDSVLNAAGLLSNDKVNVLVMENGRIKVQARTMSAEGTADNTYARAAKDQAQVSGALATRVSGEFSRYVFAQEDVSADRIKAFREAMSANLGKLDKFNSDNNNRNNYGVRFEQFQSTLGAEIDRLSGDGGNGVRRNPNAEDSEKIARDTIRTFLDGAKESRNTELTDDGIASLLSDYNKEQKDDEKISIGSFAYAIRELDKNKIQATLKNLANFVKTKSIRLDGRNFKLDNADSSSLGFRELKLADLASSRMIKGFVSELIHSSNAPDPMKGVTGDAVVAAIGNCEELKEILVNRSGSTSYEELTRRPEAAGPDAVVLFSTRAKAVNKEADARAKFLVMLDLLRSLDNDSSIPDIRRNEIYNNIISSLFKAEVDQRIKAANYNNRDQAKARREVLAELREKIQRFTKGDIDVGDLLSASDKKAEEAQKELTTAERELIEAKEEKEAKQNLDKKAKQNLEKAREKLTRANVLNIHSNGGGAVEKAEAEAEAEAAQNELTQVTKAKDEQVEAAQQRVEEAQAKVQAAQAKVQAAQESRARQRTLSEINRLCAVSTSRGMLFRTFNRTVVNATSNVAASRLASVINNYVPDRSDADTVFDTIADTIRSEMTSDSHHTGLEVVNGILGRLHSSPKIHRIFTNLVGLGSDTMLDDKPDLKESIADQLEYWLAVSEKLKMNIHPPTEGSSSEHVVTRPAETPKPEASTPATTAV